MTIFLTTPDWNVSFKGLRSCFNAKVKMKQGQQNNHSTPTWGFSHGVALKQKPPWFIEGQTKAVCVCLPDRGVQLVAGGLAIIQLCKQREEDLHASDGVYATLDRVSHHGLHVLQKQTKVVAFDLTKHLHEGYCNRCDDVSGIRRVRKDWQLGAQSQTNKKCILHPTPNSAHCKQTPRCHAVTLLLLDAKRKKKYLKLLAEG